MSERHVTVDMIIEAVSAATGFSRLDIMSQRRPVNLCAARFAIYWLASKTTPLSSSAIGRVIGHRDASTVLDGLRRAEELRLGDPDFRIATDGLLAVLIGLERAGVERLAASADPLATARRIIANPAREAVRVPVIEITAMARLIVELLGETDPSEPDLENSDAA